MSEQNKSDDKSPLPSSGIAIIALLLGLFAVQDTVFKPSRPSMVNTERAVTEDVRSRLWQDPFQAVGQHRKQYDSDKTPASRVEDPSHDIAYLIEEKSIQRICSTTEFSNVVAHSIEELRCQIYKVTHIEGKSLHILAVMVLGGSYAESEEWRLRNRYALISGLDAVGYNPVDPEHIGYVDFEEACRGKPQSDTRDQKHYICALPSFAPYEWFDLSDRSRLKSSFGMTKTNSMQKLDLPFSDPKDTVLVLWLNNDAFALSQNILGLLDYLKNDLSRFDLKKKDHMNDACEGGDINFNVIGPPDSDTLKKMYLEVNQGKESKSSDQVSGYLKNSNIFSAFATADDGQLFEYEENDDLKSPPPSRWMRDKIVRTISTQDAVSNALFCELALRGVTPYRIESNELSIKEQCRDLPGLVLKASSQPHHIVLIGELDTFYSQMLTESILKKINEFNKTPDNKEAGWIHTFNYLRGLDGITTEHASRQDNTKPRESQANKPNNKELREQLERPVGTSQLDYLLGLAEQIKHLDRLSAKEGGIKAIGITGSDTYDKLLILQALRNKFPEMLFFTTDLDARLLHPAETKWTRNLIVVSPFGLQLHDSLQEYTPPFRDSYQTSLYLTTLLALYCPHGENQCSSANLSQSIKKLDIEPRLFEIGNNGAVDISHKPGKGVHPEPEIFSIDEMTLKEFMFLVISIIILMIFLLYLVPNALQPAIFAVFCSAICLLVFYHAVSFLDGYASEPLSFTNGTSIWPANGIRLIAILLAGYFLYRVKRQLAENNERVKEEYSLKEENVQAKDTKAIESLLSRLLIDRWKECFSKNPVEFVLLWSHYLKLRGGDCCSKRVLLMLFLYIVSFMAFSQIGFLDMPRTPFRGASSFYVNEVVLFLAILLYLLLTFLIADISHLSSHFIKKMALCNVIWSEKVMTSYEKYRLPEGVVKNKILMDFIYQQANAINMFIYYPFIILFLIIISRSYYFDNWQITPLLLFIFIFTALITIGSAIRLRNATQEAKQFILAKLEGDHVESLAQDAWYRREKNADKIKLLINEIKDLKGGVFQPLSHHPIVLSLLMPFSSVGGLYLIEYFAFMPS